MTETMKTYHWSGTVAADDANCSIHSWLRERMGFTRRFLRRVKVTGILLRNGNRDYWNLLVAAGDYIELEWKEQLADIQLNHDRRGNHSDLILDIIAQDDDLCVVNKPSGMLVHPVKSERINTALDILQREQPTISFRPVNRIDRETSGIVLFSKHVLAHQKLSEQFVERSASKVYLAWVCGEVPCESVLNELPIVKDHDHAVRRFVCRGEVIPEEAQQASTMIRGIRSIELPNVGIISLVEAKPLTGRTHQIRVHLSAMGTPILGDVLYGGMIIPNIAERILLHASELRVLHPLTKQERCWHAELPDDMNLFMKLTID